MIYQPVIMKLDPVSIIELRAVTGGQQAQAQPKPTESDDERVRRIVREERDFDERMREKEEFRAWEKRHPFQALPCQGDRDCMR